MSSLRRRRLPMTSTLSTIRCCGSCAYAGFAKAREEMQMMALRKASQTTRYECIGAGSLEVSSGYLLISPPEFPDGAKQRALVCAISRRLAIGVPAHEFNQRLLRENRNTNLDDVQPGEHLDSSPPSLVASFQLNKVAHYNGKIKRKSKVEHTLDKRKIVLPIFEPLLRGWVFT